MVTQSPTHSEQKYSRDFLLSPEKRNQLIELWEVEKYGSDCFGDPDHHLYGMAPREWYERGVRILARTCLEAVKDPLGNKIGKDIAEVVARAPGEWPLGVVDPFAGSCNGLYAILRYLPGSKGIGFEVEPAVFDLTTRNIAHLKAPIELLQGSYKTLVNAKKYPTDHFPANKLPETVIDAFWSVIPVVILIFAYLHRIPIPPELMLLGDLLAYIDVFAMVFLLSMIGRVGVVLYVLKRAIDFAISCVSGALTSLRRLDFRHRRANSEGHRKRGSNQAKQSDGDYVPVRAFALSPA